MDEESVLRNICCLPISYRTLNLSPITLIQRSGYLEMPEVLKRKRISVYLRDHPQLIDAWEIWAEDARSAWCKKVDDGYAVYPGPEGKPIKFADRFEAWAEVIVRNIHHIARFVYR